MNKEQKIKKLFENANKAISESRWSDAHTLWETINKKMPDNFGIIMNLAACKNNTGLNAEARELYFKAEKLSPLNIDVNYAIALSYEYEKDFDRALEFYKKCLKINKEHFDTIIRISEIYKIMGKFDTTLKLYEYLEKIYPDNDDIKVEIASILYRLNDTFKAESILKNILSRSPDNANAKKSLAMIYHSQEDKKTDAAILDADADGEIEFGG